MFPEDHRQIVDAKVVPVGASFRIEVVSATFAVMARRQVSIWRLDMTSDDDKPLTPQQAREKLQKGLIDYLAGNDPGPIVFRLKRTKKASETYPLKLTQLQRETLLQFTQLNRKLKKQDQAGWGRHPDRWRHLERTAHAQRCDRRSRCVRTQRPRETPDGDPGKAGQVL